MNEPGAMPRILMRALRGAQHGAAETCAALR